MKIIIAVDNANHYYPHRIIDGPEEFRPMPSLSALLVLLGLGTGTSEAAAQAVKPMAGTEAAMICSGTRK